MYVIQQGSAWQVERHDKTYPNMLWKDVATAFSKEGVLNKLFTLFNAGELEYEEHWLRLVHLGTQGNHIETY